MGWLPTLLVPASPSSLDIRGAEVGSQRSNHRFTKRLYRNSKCTSLHTNVYILIESKRALLLPLIKKRPDIIHTLVRWNLQTRFGSTNTSDLSRHSLRGFEKGVGFKKGESETN